MFSHCVDVVLAAMTQPQSYMCLMILKESCRERFSQDIARGFYKGGCEDIQGVWLMCLSSFTCLPFGCQNRGRRESLLWCTLPLQDAGRNAAVVRHGLALVQNHHGKIMNARRRIEGLLVLCKSRNSCSFCHVFENAQCKRTQKVERSSKVDLHGLSSFKLMQPIWMQ